MSDLLIRGARVLRDSRLQDADVRVENGRISEVGENLARRDAELLDASGCLLAPGFIDLHIHGAEGAMFEQATPEAVARICRALPRFGVTGFLATIATVSADQLEKAVAAVSAIAGRETGARILGVHLEGPYLSPLRAGAQPIGWMRRPALEEVDRLQKIAAGRIRLVTIAPEIEGAVSLIEGLRARGVRASLGHTDGRESDMVRGIEAGATHVTHLFNAMRELHHREPGAVGVALTDDRLSVELICDGHHLASRVVDLAFRCKPPGKVVLVSDAVGALGMPDGDYEMFGVACAISQGSVRLREGGNLAGSCLGLDRAVRNVRSWLPHLPLPRVLTAASTAAADVLAERETGRIELGRAADFVVLDRDLAVAATICRGKIMWQR